MVITKLSCAYSRKIGHVNICVGSWTGWGLEYHSGLVACIHPANPILACVLWMPLRFDLLTDRIECVCVSVWCVYYRCYRSTSRTEDNPPSTNWLQSIWFTYQQMSYPVSRTSLYGFCGYQLHPCKVRYQKTILCTDVLPALVPSTEANHMNSCLPFNTCIKHSLIGVSIYVVYKHPNSWYHELKRSGWLTNIFILEGFSSASS